MEQKRQRQIERTRLRNNQNRMELKRGSNSAREGQLGSNRRKRSSVEDGLRADEQRRYDQMQSEMRGTLVRVWLGRRG